MSVFTAEIIAILSVPSLLIGKRRESEFAIYSDFYSLINPSMVGKNVDFTREPGGDFSSW